MMMGERGGEGRIFDAGTILKTEHFARLMCEVRRTWMPSSLFCGGGEAVVVVIFFWRPCRRELL